ncbi:hypothetical protein EV127DRAFT_484265 [Xylaria flabelliformis]|nr:hypothetical protein EV127DRAFT_484265 [Xylaria flabelliformis]
MAYDLSEKAWKLMLMDHDQRDMKPIILKRPVLPTHDKELIQAIVTALNTLTAESISKEQERPLYKVTCGDIGVEPENAEQYPK